MNRREFFSFAAAAPVALPMVASTTPIEYARLSVEKDDPGYEAYGRLIGDGRWPTVYLDGVKADAVVTADTREGWIKRFVMTEHGNFAHVNGDALTEVVSGRVTFDIPDYKPRVIATAEPQAHVSPDNQTEFPTANADDQCHSAQETETLFSEVGPSSASLVGSLIVSP